MPTIRIDDDVYAVLTRGLSAAMTANTALRVLLTGEDPAEVVPSTAGPNPGWLHDGKLAPLIDAGLLHDGDELTWHRRILGHTHVVTVTARGRLLTGDAREHYSPETCATALAGYPRRSWKQWRTSDGTTLHQLRERLTSQQPAGGATAGDC
jgi:Restriction Enzyme Adenine Methylase Associated